MTNAQRTNKHSLSLNAQGLATVTLSANWNDQSASHEENLYVGNMSIWREADLLPESIGQHLVGSQAGDHLQTLIQPGEKIALWDKKLQITTQPTRFDQYYRKGMTVTPRLGRFYPQGFIKGVNEIFQDAIAPIRITALNDDQLSVDLNHPLAHYPLRISLFINEVLPGSDRRGGRCISPLDDLLQYPGLSAPLQNGHSIDYGDNEDGMSRMDDRTDNVFYAIQRMKQHLDSQARETVNTLYKRLIPSEAKVLDLMASFDSHLKTIPFSELHLLGMNKEELDANKLATHQAVVQNLNENSSLSFEDDSLDAIICTVSIEYLTNPVAVLSEAMRVLCPGGMIIITFSNRWFPTKAVKVWSDLHEFERVGMVTQWLERAGGKDIHTYSLRGLPRPENDAHAGETPYSDPIYAVWAYKTDWPAANGG